MKVIIRTELFGGIIISERDSNGKIDYLDHQCKKSKIPVLASKLDYMKFKKLKGIK